MSNVLPSDTLKEIWSFHRARFVLVGSVVLLGGAFLMSTILIPTALSEGVLFSSGVAGSYDTPGEIESGEDRSDLQRARALMTALSGVATSSTPSYEVLVAAIGARPQGVRIQEMEYVGTDEGTLILNGTASNRAAISAFQEALEAIPQFKTVNVPVGAFAGAGGQFSITLKGGF